MLHKVIVELIKPNGTTFSSLDDVLYDWMCDDNPIKRFPFIKQYFLGDSFASKKKYYRRYKRNFDKRFKWNTIIEYGHRADYIGCEKVAEEFGCALNNRFFKNHSYNTTFICTSKKAMMDCMKRYLMFRPKKTNNFRLEERMAWVAAKAAYDTFCEKWEDGMIFLMFN